MGGLPQEQYNIHSSNPAARGIRYDPLRYGLKPSRYRVRHFGHSMQWRIRSVMAHLNHHRFISQRRLDVCGLCSQENEGRDFFPAPVVKLTICNLLCFWRGHFVPVAPIARRLNPVTCWRTLSGRTTCRALPFAFEELASLAPPYAGTAR